MTESVRPEPDAANDSSGQTADATAARTIVLAEYAALRSEITTLLSLQGQFLSFSVVFFGFIITMSNRDEGLPSAFLPLLPVPFGVLGLSYADVAFRIMRAARYIHHELRPRLERLGGEGCLAWETYIRERHPSRGLMHWMDRLRWSFFLAPAIAFAVYGMPAGAPTFSARWAWTAWGVSVCLVALNVLAMSRIAHFSKRVATV